MKLKTVSLLSVENKDYLLASNYRLPVEINTDTNAGLRLAVRHIIDKEYDSKDEIYKEFRKVVPGGRYLLSIIEEFHLLAGGSRHYTCDTLELDHDNKIKEEK
jgi:hypothetical protein